MEDYYGGNKLEDQHQLESAQQGGLFVVRTKIGCKGLVNVYNSLISEKSLISD